MHLLLVDLIDLEKWSLDRSETEQETESHVEHLSFEIDILYPDLCRLHMFSNILNGPLKK